MTTTTTESDNTFTITLYGRLLESLIDDWNIVRKHMRKEKQEEYTFEEYLTGNLEYFSNFVIPTADYQDLIRKRDD